MNRPPLSSASPLSEPINGPQPFSFLWGVATSGYQSEGGFNGTDQPQNNWTWAEERGVVARSGSSVDFWNKAEEDIERAAALGINSFRLGIEWSRVQPCLTRPPELPPNPIQAPPFDETALERYGAILLKCRQLKIEPIITLHHFVHPAWLGLDPWLSREIFPHFDRYVEKTILFLMDYFSRHQAEPPRIYITINEPNMLAFNHYAWLFFPSGNHRGLSPTATCLAHLLEAHSHAYLLIHKLYAQRLLPRPMVSFNNYCSDLYWGDQAWQEFFIYGAKHKTRLKLFRKLKKRADKFDATLRDSPMEIHRGLRKILDRALKTFHYPFGEKLMFHPAFDSLIDLLLRHDRPLLDFLAYDYYDPFSAHIFRLPYSQDLEPRKRTWQDLLMESITSKWWEWRAVPQGMLFYSRWLAQHQFPQLIAENGMAYRLDPQSQELHRRDGLRRADFLSEHLQVVDQIRSEGIPLIGYCYWSLFDNYEWGTYTPRFGLYTIDYSDPKLRRDPMNTFGENISEIYANHIQQQNR